MPSVRGSSAKRTKRLEKHSNVLTSELIVDTCETEEIKSCDLEEDSIHFSNAISLIPLNLGSVFSSVYIGLL